MATKKHKHVFYSLLSASVFIIGASFIIVTITLNIKPLPSPTVPAAPAVANTTVVGPNATGDSCTESSPCGFFTGLGKVMQKGGTLLVNDGDYTNMVTNYSSASNNNISGKPVVIKARNRGKARLQFKESSLFGLYLSGGSITIEGLDISGPKLVGGLALTDVSSSLSHVTVHDIALSTCTTGAGIAYFSTDSSRTDLTQTADSVIVYNIGPEAGSCTKSTGILSTVSQLKLSNSIISSIAGTCVSLSERSQQILVLNNAIDHCRGNGMLITSEPANNSAAVSGMVANNIIRDSELCIEEQQYVGKILYQSNNCWHNQKNYLKSLQRTQNSSKNDNAIAANFYYVDPQYKSYSESGSPLSQNADYSLKSSSLLINKGTDTTLSKDILGNQRPKSGAHDIGPYEQ